VSINTDFEDEPGTLVIARLLAEFPEGLHYFGQLKSRLVAGFSVTGLVSFWLSAPIRKSARYEEALVR
jgi:hypothetical protein